MPSYNPLLLDTYPELRNSLSLTQRRLGTVMPQVT
jgi:hypothetical protein